MLALLNSIYAKFTGDSGLTSAFPGGMHRDRAAEGTAMPYVVSQVHSSKTEFAYGGTSRTETQIRFSAYGVGHDATGAAMQTLVSEFDFALLTLSGSAINDTVVRLTDPVPKLHRQDANGNDVWEWSVTYEYGTIT
jgi:hypothetical protein